MKYEKSFIVPTVPQTESAGKVDLTEQSPAVGVGVADVVVEL